MIIFKKSTLSKKEEAEIRGILAEITDEYSDFYVTRDNIRLYIKDNPEILINSMKKGNRIAFADEIGIAIVDGYADNAKRKYVKILANSPKKAEKLLYIITKNVNDSLFTKLKKNNPLVKMFSNNNFKFKGNRGEEILLNKEKYNDNDK